MKRNEINCIERFYRDFSDSSRWKSFHVKVETSDLYIRAKTECYKTARDLVFRLRTIIREHTKNQEDFLNSFSPVPRCQNVHSVIENMYEASELAQVGPMAAVAGIIAEEVGKQVSMESSEVIVENGGDIWMKLDKPIKMGIYAGKSKFSGTLGIKIHPEQTPLGICTSSGIIGHSASFGKADAVTITASSAALADAVATATANRVQNKQDIEKALDFAVGIDGINAALIICENTIGIRGAIELATIEPAVESGHS